MYLCFLYLVEELGNCNVKMQIICTSAIEMQSEKKKFAIGYGLPMIKERALGRSGFYAEFQ